jgi:cytidine deaminase
VTADFIGGVRIPPVSFHQFLSTVSCDSASSGVAVMLRFSIAVPGCFLAAAAMLCFTGIAGSFTQPVRAGAEPPADTQPTTPMSTSRPAPAVTAIEATTAVNQEVDLALVRKAVEAARAASRNAWCPYSKFPVGAAIVTGDNEVYSGCNVENASYGLTICAERNAIGQAVARGQRDIKLVVVYTPTEKATAPCGACRQVINEFGPQAAVLCVCDSESRIEDRLDALLKQAFGPRNLE